MTGILTTILTTRYGHCLAGTLSTTFSWLAKLRRAFSSQ